MIIPRTHYYSYDYLDNWGKDKVLEYITERLFLAYHAPEEWNDFQMFLGGYEGLVIDKEIVISAYEYERWLAYHEYRQDLQQATKRG